MQNAACRESKGLCCDGERCANTDDTLDEFQIETFLRMTESLDVIKKMSDQNGLETSPMSRVTGRTGKESSLSDAFKTFNAERSSTDRPTDRQDVSNVTVHASVMYYGDRLALSRETVQLTMSKSDYDMFCRVVKCFTDMIMGTYTNKEVQNLREDHNYMLRRWDFNSGVTGDSCPGDMSADDPRRTMSDEIHKMIKNMLETPVYYTSSCMALIACGIMLRELFKSTLNREANDFNDLMEFVRKYMRHNPMYPFVCECKPTSQCSDAYKTLLSLILEIPPLIHNQTYMLQILAYLMYDKEGREEIFVVNMKNVVSPGLLDKIPTRLAMLIGSLDKDVIKTRMKQMRKDTARLIIGNKAAGLTDKRQYNRTVLENLITAVHDPRIGQLINALPGAENATVELIFERCKDKRLCLNADNSGDIYTPKDNNYGKNRCCGYLRLDPMIMLSSSISLLQLCVYLYTDTRQAPTQSQRHFFVRDILKAMAKSSIKIDDNILQDIFGYLDRCDVFKGFAHNPIFTSTFYKLFQSYLKSMKNMANQIKTKRRKVNRVLERISTNTISMT